MIKIVDELFELSNRCAPLEELVAREVRRDFILDYIYNSVVMEGSSLSKEETRQILFDEESIRHKSLKEHVDVFCELEGYLKVEYLLSQGEGVGVFAMKELHRKLDKASSGGFRKDKIVLYGAPNQFPLPEKVRQLVDKIVSDFNFSLSGTHFIHRLAYFHLDFEIIHPFASKNGSLGRLLVNLALMKAGFPPIVFLASDKERYYGAFASYFQSGGDGSEMCRLIEEYVISSLRAYVDNPRRDKFVIIGK